MKKDWLSVALLLGSLFFGSCAPGRMAADTGASLDVKKIEAVQKMDSSADSLKNIYRASNARVFDLLHTRLEVRPVWKTQQLDGTAVLLLRPYFYPQRFLTLDAKQFDIHEVKFPGDEPRALSYEYQKSKGKLVIDLGRKFTKEEKIEIQISYTANPNDIEVKGSRAITSDKGLYFINPDSTQTGKPTQLWTQGETEAASCWFPTIDSPNERTTQEMFITVEEPFKTLSNGVLVYSKFNNDQTRTDYWKMDKPHAPYLFMMAVGDFAVIEDQWRDLDLKYYVDPEYAEDARAIFGNTPEMIEFFSAKLDYPFPWQKYSQVVVHDFVSGAMENTTASVFMGQLHTKKRELVDHNWEKIIAHELFHQWFGDLVTCESWSNLTMNEAFANYSEYLWYEYKYGKDKADELHLEEMEGYFAEADQEPKDLVRFHYADREDMFDAHSYNKGGRVLHMLRGIVGDEAFFASLSSYLKDNAFQSVEVHDLRLVFEKTTGLDLNWFFNQWFLSKGHPELEVSYTYNEEQKELELTVEQKQDLEAVPLFMLPVHVELWRDGKVIEEPLVVSQKKEVFRIGAEQAPDHVVFDSEQRLLAQIEVRQVPEQWKKQYEDGADFITRVRALNGLIDAWGDSIQDFGYFEKVLEDESPTIREFAVTTLEKAPELSAEVVNRIIGMASREKEPALRASALSFLMERGLAPKHAGLFKHSLADSSYSVLGAAVMGYAQSSPADLMQVADSLASEDNLNVVLALANIFIEKKEFSRYGWFVEKYGRQKDVGQWYLLQLMGQLMLEAPEIQKQMSAGFLKQVALNHSKAELRLTAFQFLQLLEVDGLEGMLDEIVRNEKNDEVLEFYKSMREEAD
ncbi:MAG: M1 family metallopeptidase [Cytophagales bacterium]|nr:M1 family metallopeptidase [Cytophagales bacterium]